MKNDNVVLKKTLRIEENPFLEVKTHRTILSEREPAIKENESGHPATSTHFHILISLERLLRQETLKKKDYLSNSMDG